MIIDESEIDWYLQSFRIPRGWKEDSFSVHWHALYELG